MRRLPALGLVLLASACAGDGDKETVTVTTAATVTVTETTAGTTTQTAPAPSGTWNGLPQPLPANGILPVKAFNAFAGSVDEPWERDVAATVDEFIGPDASEAPSVSFQATSGPEGSGPTSAYLLLDGLLDDSVRSRRYDLKLSRRQDGTWRIDSAYWTQRCQKDRGHQVFIAKPCV